MADLREIMTGRLVTVSKETPVAEVARTMVQSRVGSAVIMPEVFVKVIGPLVAPTGLTKLTRFSPDYS